RASPSASAPFTTDLAGHGRRLVFRTRSGKHVLVQEDRVQVSGATLDPASAGREIMLAAKAGQEVTVSCPTATAWGARETEAAARVERALQGAAGGVQPVLAAHRDAWSKLWDADVVIEGNPTEQQIVRSWMFYLLQSVRPDSGDSIPPMGLSDDAFA